MCPQLWGGCCHGDMHTFQLDWEAGLAGWGENREGLGCPLQQGTSCVSVSAPHSVVIVEGAHAVRAACRGLVGGAWFVGRRCGWLHSFVECLGYIPLLFCVHRLVCPVTAPCYQ